MAKQKFRCTGVVKKTGQRVAIEVSAEDRQEAIAIAARHGVVIQQIAPAEGNQPAAANPVQPKVPEPLGEGLDENVEGLFDSPQDEGDRDAMPAAASTSATKACPYCGEQILAVAIKCKHCGSYVAEPRMASRRAAEPAEAAKPGVVGSRRKVWIAVAGVAAIVLLAVIGLIIWLVTRTSPPKPLVAPPPAPPAAPAAPAAPVAKPPEKPKHSAEEIAFATKLSAFLDACEDMAKVIEDVPTPEKCREQNKAMEAKWKEVPKPPKGAAWATEATSACHGLLQLAGMLETSMTTLEEAMRASGQTLDSKTCQEACQQAAEQLRKLLPSARALIPADCLTAESKSK